MLYPFAMIMLVEGTLVRERLLPRFCNVDFIGLPFFVIPMHIVLPMRDGKVGEYWEKKYDAIEPYFDC